MVRVLAVADEVDPMLTDARVRGLRPDLVVSAGDLPWDYLEHVVSLTGAPAVFVPGNHEPPFEPGSAPRGMVSADEQVTDVGGLRVAGLGGCVRYNDADHQFTQEQYDTRAKRVRRAAVTAGAVDVLVTHAPPLGLGDATDPSHLGIEALHGLLAALAPAWHLHGHIHPYGMRKADRAAGPTTIRNVIPWSVIEMERA